MHKILNLLGLNEKASRETVRKAYKKIILTLHPDNGGKAEEFRQYHTAYQEYLFEIGELQEIDLCYSTIKEVVAVCLDNRMFPNEIIAWVNNFFLTQIETLNTKIDDANNSLGYLESSIKTLTFLSVKDFNDKVLRPVIKQKIDKIAAEINNNIFQKKIYEQCIDILGIIKIKELELS